ncbi:MAG: YdcF family protein, partial [Phycisphaerae bacterium]|nr:YdcF family protein [Phycisphaerae bacterium]
VYRAGWAPLVVCSGNVGELTKNLYDQAEGRVFAQICEARGVPPDRILVEDQATHSGENAAFCRALFAARGIEPRSLILVQKPYMERRAFATFRKVWPGPRLIVTSPQIPYEKYATADISTERIIHIIVGDLQRIALYPRLGYQVEQEIPTAVWDAFRELVAMGFTGHLAASDHPVSGSP